MRKKLRSKPKRRVEISKGLMMIKLFLAFAAMDAIKQKIGKRRWRVLSKLLAKSIQETINQ